MNCGVQTPRLGSGLHLLIPFLNSVRKFPFPTIDQKEVGILESIEGDPLPPGKIFAQVVVGHNAFQDGESFMKNGGRDGDKLFLMNRRVTSRALQGVPVEYFSTFPAGRFFILLFYPFLGSLVLHDLEIFNHLFVVPDSVHYMNFGKILQALTGEIAALETPGYFFLLSATAETVAAVATSGVDIVGKASVATDGFDRDLIGFRHLLQFIQILVLIGQVPGAGPAVKTADSNQLVL